jgi:hypothetical protein
VSQPVSIGRKVFGGSGEGSIGRQAGRAAADRLIERADRQALNAKLPLIFRVSVGATVIGVGVYLRRSRTKRKRLERIEHTLDRLVRRRQKEDTRDDRHDLGSALRAEVHAKTGRQTRRRQEDNVEDAV